MRQEYYSAKQLAGELGMSLRTVQRRLQQMEPLVGTEYPESLDDGKLKRVRLVDFVHFCNHRKEARA